MSNYVCFTSFTAQRACILAFSASVIASFMAGVLLTLLMTGSIKIHGEVDTVDRFPKEEKAPRKDSAKNVEGIQQDAISKPQPISSSEPVTDERFINMLKNNIDNYKVIPDSITDPDEARIVAFDYFKTTPSITRGNGDKHIYIVFDPLCPHCHTLYNTYTVEELDRLNLTAHWIPAVALLDNETSHLFVQRIVSALMNNAEDQASNGLHELMTTRNTAPLNNPQWVVTEQAIVTSVKNTLGLLQLGTGTPTTLYLNEAGKVEVMGGLPNESDFQSVKETLK